VKVTFCDGCRRRIEGAPAVVVRGTVELDLCDGCGPGAVDAVVAALRPRRRAAIARQAMNVRQGLDKLVTRH
jgi:ribosome-binding protein aMBF1 (putative translation factor)